MTDKQLRKLKRSELIELVYHLRKENERLEKLAGGKERTLSQADIDAVAQGVAERLAGNSPGESIPAESAPAESVPAESVSGDAAPEQPAEETDI